MELSQIKEVAWVNKNVGLSDNSDISDKICVIGEARELRS